jgi:hypothetical protein
VVAHLRACGDVLGGNMLLILAEDRPTYQSMNPRAYLKKTDYPEWKFKPAFEAFSKQRAELLNVLDATPREAWSRFAHVTGMLKEAYERDVRFYGEWLAGHERANLPHIRRILDAVRGSA